MDCFWSPFHTLWIGNSGLTKLIPSTERETDLLVRTQRRNTSLRPPSTPRSSEIHDGPSYPPKVSLSDSVLFSFGTPGGEFQVYPKDLDKVTLQERPPFNTNNSWPYPPLSGEQCLSRLLPWKFKPPVQVRGPKTGGCTLKLSPTFSTSLSVGWVVRGVPAPEKGTTSP